MRPISWPLFITLRIAIAGAPLFRAAPVMVTSSPTLIVLFVQPVPFGRFGLQFAFPFLDRPMPVEGSFTSMVIITCGLMNWKSVTVPVTVTIFEESYAAAP